MIGRAIVLLCVVVLSTAINKSNPKLEQVLILSRHNVRTPLTAQLESYSSQPWPKWNDSTGYLTKRGAQLERFMGEYIAEWLDSEDFFLGCPNNGEVLIYANTKPRTLSTAKAFAESAFPLCNFTVQHYENLEVFDPMFLPIFHNKTAAFKKQMRREMEAKLNEVNLTLAYQELNRIIDVQNSDICKKTNICDLSTEANVIVTEDDEEPNVSGPLFIGNAIVDDFIMSYYEDKPLADVAWGQITSDQQWDLLLQISRQNQNVRFNLTTGSKDLAKPLLKYMFDIFKTGIPKFTMLVGHDSNMNSVISALSFKPFVLPNQFEPFPIGGKVVFQKWSDQSGSYLKIEYVYQTTNQLRNCEHLSLKQPPQRLLLELKDCKISPSGFCPWTEFMKLNLYS